MPSSFTNLIYHVALATEGRQPIILPGWREELHRYIGGIIRRHGGVLYEIKAMPEHVHLLASLKAEPSLAAIVRTIKASSSNWINKHSLTRDRFEWEHSYRAFSIGATRLAVARRFTRDQEQHHLKRSFREEREAISKKQAAMLGQSDNLLLYHIVFGTKYRRPVILPKWKTELYQYIRDVVVRQGGVIFEINGMSDHVHLLAGFQAEPSVATMLRLLKTNSSKWVNENRLMSERFGWQVGYAAFSVSASQLQTVRRYIQRQEEHHAHISFDAEMKSLVRRRSPSPTGSAIE